VANDSPKVAWNLSAGTGTSLTGKMVALEAASIQTNGNSGVRAMRAICFERADVPLGYIRTDCVIVLVDELLLINRLAVDIHFGQNGASGGGELFLHQLLCRGRIGVGLKHHTV
jgi:hypothetical protein